MGEGPDPPLQTSGEGRSTARKSRVGGGGGQEMTSRRNQLTVVQGAVPAVCLVSRRNWRWRGCRRRPWVASVPYSSFYDYTRVKKAPAGGSAASGAGCHHKDPVLSVTHPHGLVPGAGCRRAWVL